VNMKAEIGANQVFTKWLAEWIAENQSRFGHDHAPTEKRNLKEKTKLHPSSSDGWPTNDNAAPTVERS
jgi:hypothetical protein